MSDDTPSTPDTPEPDSPDLAAALAKFDLDLPAETVERLDAYRALLWEWNGRMNLTRHTTFDKFASRDVVDSLELAKLIDQNDRVLDIGSGGGVPGMVVAIVRPDLQVQLCDSVTKKAGALQAMVEELGINCQVHASRVEQVLEHHRFNTLTARGVASLKKFMTWLRPQREAFDRLLLVKGRSWADERGEARHYGLLKGYDLRKAAEYTTPRTDAISVILRVTPTGRPG
ncbi:Ribosomal RNA small subunit methyltransferase G [Pseudobythopirellula maris]|uniref:Ribosomal RNA small subunit methyltransferase G n=1 Tax=Pseudobythopirellula maris TaxID=2527991 RepID=A0A5C5ZLI5_9BACT|nr:16S rRNA (guanine(527)-N(7))-methyltransferase RsmG [Pseudobythopirellula maris]TWT88312.1 Ribosomal RNA small subunit methyltransferase G [Pseudobythopirellula maris]